MSSCETHLTKSATMTVNGFHSINSSAVEDNADVQAVKEIRKLVIDICRQNDGGHGGSAIGMAPLAVALWKHTMRYNARNADVRTYRSQMSGY